MEISKKTIEEMRELIRKKEGKEPTDQEAYDAAFTLTRYVELVWEVAMRQAQKNARIKKEPEGFPIEERLTCLVCGQMIDETNGWYSWYGQTCLLCKQAIADGVIPTFVATDRDSYFPMWKLNSNVQHQNTEGDEVCAGG